MSEGTETVESDYKVEGRGAVTRPNDWIRLESASHVIRYPQLAQLSVSTHP